MKKFLPLLLIVSLASCQVIKEIKAKRTEKKITKAVALLKENRRLDDSCAANFPCIEKSIDSVITFDSSYYIMYANEMSALVDNLMYLQDSLVEELEAKDTACRKYVLRTIKDCNQLWAHAIQNVKPIEKRVETIRVIEDWARLEMFQNMYEDSLSRVLNRYHGMIKDCQDNEKKLTVRTTQRNVLFWSLIGLILIGAALFYFIAKPRLR